jgi:hypothetical protein
MSALKEISDMSSMLNLALTEITDNPPRKLAASALIDPETFIVPL